MPSKTRILYTIPNFKTAGSQYVVMALVERIDKTRFEPLIGVERFPETIPQIIPQKNQVVLAKNGNLRKDALAFSKLLKKQRIDLVHSWDYKSEFVEAIGCKLARVPYLFTKKNDAWSKRWFLKSLLATHIAYDNPEMKSRFFSNRIFQKKITFIPHGVDTALFKPSPVKLKASEKFTICSVGNIGDNKNQMFLIKALKALPERVHLNIYGKADTAYLKKMQQLIQQENLEGRVHIEGFVPNNQLPGILQQQDVFVLASKKEGLPVSILEALACGVPVLCSDSGGGSRYIFKETISENIFDLKKPQDFVDKCKPLLENEKYYFRKRKEAVQIAARFDVEKEVASYSKLYDKLV
ncbi:glycosyltransferase family 4 protein [Marixanthomonas spongiae]|uniref:Glycosyltransferase n=1 Tax=Marixanthomonas spongiae TaxID=2174845 RepID=A0A2U0I5T4_9FLAO|nr:glycosyltransferase family 4 protein [Marixanthomonas spongiae]PVW16466.1 hypothetical protein DDV96_04205 [Marixanthomonas spongiae]